MLLRRRWPLQVLIACSVLLMVYYTAFRRNISPAPLLSLPLYDAALAGYLAVSIIIPAIPQTTPVRAALAAIRQTSKSALAERSPAGSWSAR